MKNRKFRASPGLIPLALLLLPFAAGAQVPVDDDGNLIDARGFDAEGAYEGFSPAEETGDEGIPLLAPSELEELVDVIALYPDDLLAIVLPASTYPLQIVQAARFLEDLESDPSLEPDPEWDDSVIALLNYPEAVRLLNEDLDWTWRLGEAVVAQQADVLSAIESFRNRAYAAGNLQSDQYQTVTDDGGIIEITPVNDEIIYVPYYEPSRVVRYQSRPVYYYYPEPCPVYYYPYPSNYIFDRNRFWGVTTAFSIGWTRRHLNVFHHSYGGHPYFGVRYWDRWWYRRPSITIHNTVYVNDNGPVSASRYYHGDSWRPSRNTRLRHSDQRITRNTYVPRREAIGVPRSTFSPARRANTANRSIRNPVERRAAAQTGTSSTEPRRTASTTPRDRTSTPRDRTTTPRDRTAEPRGYQLRQRDEGPARAQRSSRRTDREPPVAVPERNRSTQPRTVRTVPASSEPRARPVKRIDRRSQPAPQLERRAVSLNRQPDRRAAAPATRPHTTAVSRGESRPVSQRSSAAPTTKRRSASSSPKKTPSRTSTRRR